MSECAQPFDILFTQILEQGASEFLANIKTDVTLHDGFFVKAVGKLSAVFNNCELQDSLWSCPLCDPCLKPAGYKHLKGEIKEHDQVSVAEYSTGALIVFRGTHNIYNMGSDINLSPIDPWAAWSCATGRVHAGFLAVWKSLRATLKTELQRLQKRSSKAAPLRVLLTGHSLGAAVATIAALDFSTSLDMMDICVVVGNLNFESPLVFTKGILSCYRVPTVRVTNTRDPVPHMPKHLAGYAHVGAEIFMRRGQATWCSQADVEDCEAGKKRCACSSGEKWYSFRPLSHCRTKHYLGFDFCECGGSHTAFLRALVWIVFLFILGLVTYVLYRVVRSMTKAGRGDNPLLPDGEDVPALPGPLEAQLSTS